MEGEAVDCASVATQGADLVGGGFCGGWIDDSACVGLLDVHVSDDLVEVVAVERGALETLVFGVEDSAGLVKVGITLTNTMLEQKDSSFARLVARMAIAKMGENGVEILLP